jgi:acetylornithine deacetylase/succinyl-diaminopimelate desuccinylase-like protein
VVRGQAGQWRAPLSPFQLTDENGSWYGRGSADNKGQHSINLAAIEQILARRGALGLNLIWLIEMAEEQGSPGLEAFCRSQKALLAADLFLASDGPRLNAAMPTVFLGSRGCCNFELTLKARDGAHHSGNWGGLLMNPAVRLAHALATLVDQRGRILVPELMSPAIPASVRDALKDVIPGEPNGPAIDPDWADPDRSLAERVFASNSLEILALGAGRIDTPVNAIPGIARAVLQLRFVPGCDPADILPAVRRHLEQCGFADVTVSPCRDEIMKATRLDPAHPVARAVCDSITATTGTPPVVLPSLGGTLPNACFADVLGLPTVWVPHSYPGCNQHAPDEHLRASVARQGLAIMVGILWDLAEHDRVNTGTQP